MMPPNSSESLLSFISYLCLTNCVGPNVGKRYRILRKKSQEYGSIFLHSLVDLEPVSDGDFLLWSKLNILHPPVYIETHIAK